MQRMRNLIIVFSVLFMFLDVALPNELHEVRKPKHYCALRALETPTQSKRYWSLRTLTSMALMIKATLP